MIKNEILFFSLFFFWEIQSTWKLLVYEIRQLSMEYETWDYLGHSYNSY